MTSAWQNLNGPLELARMRSGRAPELDAREPIRPANPDLVGAEPDTYDRAEPVLRRRPPARPIRQSGFAPVRPGSLALAAGASEAARHPQTPTDGAALGTTFADQRRAPKQGLQIQAARGGWERADGEPVQRKLPIWAPPHVRAHPCQLPVAGTDTGPGSLWVVSCLPRQNGLQCAEKWDPLRSEIEPVLKATLPERRDGMISSSPWEVRRPAPALRILSPRLGIPLPTLEQRGQG